MYGTSNYGISNNNYSTFKNVARSTALISVVLKVQYTSYGSSK